MLRNCAGRSGFLFIAILLFLVPSAGGASAGERVSPNTVFAQFSGGSVGGSFPSGGGSTIPPAPGPVTAPTPTLPTTPQPGEELPIEIDEQPETIETELPDVATLPFLEPGQQPQPLHDPFGDLPVGPPPDLPPILPSNPNPPDDDERPPGFAPSNAPFYVVGGNVGAAPIRYPTANPAPPKKASPAGSPPRGPEEFFDLSQEPETRRQQLLALATVLITAKEVDGTDTAVCTGSHLGNRMILTAHHCLHDQQAGQQFEDFKVRFGQVSHDDVVSRAGIPAQPLSAMNPDEQQLDFLILALEEPAPIEFRGAVVKLTNHNPWEPFLEATRLETFLIWNDPRLDPAFAKLRSSDELCVSKRGVCRAGRVGNLHGCDSSKGSSGAPIFAYGGHEVLAIHIAGSWPNVSNCALPIAHVLGALDSAEAPVMGAVLRAE